MADYFSEYSTFVGAKGLPSPADTPYETPGFIRSKRSSRATAGSSREQSESPPPLPPDTTEYQERSRDGRYSALDPRRFTPTLHASLVSEILNLRRELDSKNSLVENLETSLSTTKTENEMLSGQLSEHAKEIRKAKQQVQQMETGTYDVVAEMAKERDTARRSADDMRTKLDATAKKVRLQDEDALRTQGIWENEKESWENERRQLERRVHVTENRLRTFVDEMTAQQALADTQTGVEEMGDESTFKDSGFGNESDTASIISATPTKHRRNRSSLSYRTRSIRNSASTRASTSTPEPHTRSNGYSLADELGIDEEDEYDIDDFEHADDELDYPGSKRRTMEQRRNSIIGDMDSKAKRVLGLTSETPDSPTMAPTRSPTKREFPKRSLDPFAPIEPSRLSTIDIAPLATVPQQPEPAPRVIYVDTGYQPSPPASPQSKATMTEQSHLTEVEEPLAQIDADSPGSVQLEAAKHALEVATRVAASPISPPQTPVMDGVTWPEDKRMSIPAPAYSTAATQTDFPEPAQPKSLRSNRDSLSPPMFVPAIAIHPPTSRPSSPRKYVLPPGTKNASTQAAMPWPGQDASMQTEEIRVDKRLRRLPSHLLPSRLKPALLPSPTFPEHPQPKEASNHGSAKIFTKVPASAALPSPPLQSPIDSSPERPFRDNSSRDTRNLPLRAIPLPRPVLAPAQLKEESSSEGPLNRSSQYGVTRPLQSSSQLLDIDKDSDASDYEDAVSDVDLKDLTGSIPAFSRAPHGRFGLSEPPKVVPEDKEISPERRPGTAESYGAAPAPSIASSRATSSRMPSRPPAKLNAYKDLRSRSPSFGSVASSSHSTQSALPPYPIPTRSSSRVMPNTHSEGSQSPTPRHGDDIFGRGGHRSSRGHHVRQNSLRKVQSAAVMRQTSRIRTSPPKGRRRRRSPDLTPVQSMAFDTPTQFPIPDLPTPLQGGGFDLLKGSVELTKRPTTATTMIGNSSEETNLVDAIAATMVGEWMWKYIRKRKSFGIGEETSEFPHDGANGAVSIAAHGTRHKRWVWLSPYERTIMWDSKQPTSGPALMGKKGRKLTIQSVLDVQDDTPLPKGPDLPSAFNRSILILTPARALKFTAISKERHGLWMTALSFLAQSGRLPAQFPQMPSLPPPPPPIVEAVPVKRQRSPSFGRATIRDSVRLAKGRRPNLQQSVSQPMPVGDSAILDGDMAAEDQGADFPAVPRLYISTTRHQRKRSNTSPRLPAPLNNLRSFSSSAIPSTASSRLHPASTNGSSIRADLRSSSSKSGSRRDSITSPDGTNFFEAVGTGTVRMEAFVDPNVRDGVLYVPAPPLAPPSALGHRRRRGDSNMSTATADKRRAGYVFDENGMDPFKGF